MGGGMCELMHGLVQIYALGWDPCWSHHFRGNVKQLQLQSSKPTGKREVQELLVRLS